MRYASIARRALFALAVTSSAACTHHASRSQPSVTQSADTRALAVIQGFMSGTAAVHTRNPDVKLSVERDPASSSERILVVDYPPSSNDPSARDVAFDLDERNWTRGRELVFQIKSAHPSRISISFLDRNHVVYTTWSDLPDT